MKLRKVSAMIHDSRNWWLLSGFGDYWLNSDDSTGNNDIVGDNEGPTAVMYYQLPPGIESFMIQMSDVKNR